MPYHNPNKNDTPRIRLRFRGGRGGGGGGMGFVEPNVAISDAAKDVSVSVKDESTQKIINQGVSVGPFCTVGPSAVLGNNCKLHPGSHVCGNTELGDKCILMSGAIVGDNLLGKTIIGCNNVIGHHVVVGIKCQDMKYKAGNECFLEVGDNNEITEHVSIHRSLKPCGSMLCYWR
nr:probable acyl-[acyl-carrier-protein]--UDP-N-acetylglucosamine O-acyltransferase, mitochondrial isoform X1 [Tanacetum cinerariifolium]